MRIMLRGGIDDEGFCEFLHRANRGDKNNFKLTGCRTIYLHNQSQP